MRKNGKEIYKDTSQPIDLRVADLMSRMTVTEKMNQLTSVLGRDLIDEKGKLAKGKASELLQGGIGQISRPAGSTYIEPSKAAKFINEIQSYLVNKTRLGIPAMMHEECLMGFQVQSASVFPQSINMACTWDTELINEMAAAIRSEIGALRIQQVLAPVLDIAREPRWGRVEETYGEDPYLVASMAKAYIRGIQESDPSEKIVATLKHFAGYSVSEGGLNWAPSHIPERELREVFLFPFEVAVREAKVGSVMNGYHEIDGVPCAASRKLLTDILRGEWGFRGTVVADYAAVINLHEYHKVASTPEDAAVLALTAGLDIELPRRQCFTKKLEKQFVDGTLPIGLLDESVERVLRMKFQLGIFENPYVDEKKAGTLFDKPHTREIARKAAQRSIVLLKNEKKFLPLKKDLHKIAVIGPNADSWRNLLGDYCYAELIESQMVFREKMNLDDVKNLPNPSVPVVSVLDGIKSKLSKRTEILYAKGCDVLDKSTAGFKDAINAAKKADVAIVVLGGKSGFLLDCTSGEEVDKSNLGLHGVQEQLLKEIYKTGTPVVLVLVDGKPLAIEWAEQNIPAILHAWLPGEEGGNAIADILFGDINPGGKLAVSMPRHAGQIPIYYDHKPSGRKSHLWGKYVDSESTSLFQFGHGLSYTTFEYSALSIKPVKAPSAGNIQIGFSVKNTGKVVGDEVVQLYINDEYASITRPVKELKGFKRITLKPGERKIITFDLSTDQLAFYDMDMKLAVEPGVFNLMVGSSSSDIRLTGKFEVVGEKRIIMGSRRYLTNVIVEK